MSKMNDALWIIQVLLALAFGIAGGTKLILPIERLKERMGWVNDVPPSSVRVIGALEVSAAVGLLLPALTGILPWLTPLAAVGLILTMIGAITVHVRRKEVGRMAPSIVLLVLAIFIAYGRFVVVPL